jgi:hypothetical protein
MYKGKVGKRVGYQYIAPSGYMTRVFAVMDGQSLLAVMVGIGQDAWMLCEAVHCAVSRVTHARGRRVSPFSWHGTLLPQTANRYPRGNVKNA